MSRVRLRVRDQAPRPVIPFPDQFRIARERARRRKILGAILFPQSSVAAKSRHTTLGRYPRAREHGDGSGLLEPFANLVHCFQSTSGAAACALDPERRHALLTEPK